MAEMSQVQGSVVSVPEGLMKLAGWCAYISGVVAIIGLVFLFLFFGGAGDFFGPLNDVMVIIHYVLLLPIAVTIWWLLRPLENPLNTPVLIVGLVAMLAVIVLQGLLVAGVLPFQRQIAMVVPAFLVGMAWFVATGQMARSLDILPKSAVLQVLAGLVFGYPVWAFKVGTRLLGGG